MDNYIDVLRMKRGIKAGNLVDNHRGPVVGLISIEAPIQFRDREPARLVSASLDNTIRVWEPKDMSCNFVLDNSSNNEISSFHFLANANLIVSGHENGEIKLWNIELGSSIIL